MTVYLNRRIIGGVIKAPPERGRVPYEWLLWKIETVGSVWDNSGRRTQVRMLERVLVQGRANCAACAWAVPGVEVLADGIGLPAYTVAQDSEIRGIVTVCQSLQRPGAQED